jgi:uncharacterized protein YdeI (YjbR/CyaY-like superfamily)
MKATATGSAGPKSARQGKEGTRPARSTPIRGRGERTLKNASPKVDVYLSEAEKWKEESETLRMICLGCGLTEELKWAKPCYTLNESNVVIIQGFRDYCALMFCKGSLLKDTEGVLKKPGENTQAARQLRFTSVREIVGMEPLVKAYIHEAIDAEKAGLKVAFKKNPEPVPEELQKKLDETPALKAAFTALTPGRQRAYILFISAAKQSTTRDSRIEKYRRQILSGKGLND